jgi:hypothetical protein
MSGMTYDSLVSDISTYAERDDDPFLSTIPQFVSLAENRLAAEVKPLGFVRVVTGFLSGILLSKPARWRRTKSFSVLNGSERRYMFQRTYEYCRQYSVDPSVVGIPRYYANYDYEHFFIAPNPNAQYPFELSYYELPDPLSDENQTNWTTQYAPQLLLYASLLEAQPFLKTSERLAEFQGLFDRALAALIKENGELAADDSA